MLAQITVIITNPYILDSIARRKTKTKKYKFAQAQKTDFPVSRILHLVRKVMVRGKAVASLNVSMRKDLNTKGIFYC
jgi:ABC-type antimicrobial peptide transport system ATPase subunit